MTICCANCESALLSSTVGDTFHLYPGDTDEIVTVSVADAVSVVFAYERNASANQNCCVANRIRLCPNCICVMAELYRFFTRFKNQATGSSYIQHILSDPNWTLHDVNCINNPNHDYAASVKEEEEEYENDNNDKWIVPDVQIIQLEPDFVIKCDSTEEMSTRLRFRKARVVTPLHQAKKGKLSTPKRNSIRRNPIPIKRSLRLAEKLSCDIFNTTSSSPETGQSDGSKKSPKTFPCYQCVPPKGFVGTQSLTIHERAFHPKDEDSQRQFKCPRCFLQLRGERGFRSHMKREHQEVAKFSCPNCPKSFTRMSSMTEHVKAVHVGYSAEEQETNSCPVCGKVYPSKNRLKAHLQIIHTAGEALSCKLCDKRFFGQRHFEMHVNEVHFKERDKKNETFNCTICEKTYTTIEGVRKHVNIVHLRKDEFICDVCGFKTTAKPYFRSHMESHNTELKYSCQTCSKLFKTRRALKKHKFSHEGGNCLCPYCGKALNKPESLTRHIQALHREYPEVASKTKSHPCPICGKDFKLRDYLRQHLLSKAHGGPGRHQKQVTVRSREAKKMKGW